MNGFRFIKGAAISIATLSLVFPQVQLLAQETPARPAAKATKVVTLPNIALTTGGTLSGRVVDHTGKVLEGAQVTVRQGKTEIGKTVTNKEGQYSFKNMKGGVYQVASGNTEGIFRVWAEKTAPPAAKEHALLVMGEKGTRGQFGGTDPTTVVLVGGVLAAVVLSAMSYEEAHEIDSKFDKRFPATP